MRHMRWVAPAIAVVAVLVAGALIAEGGLDPGMRRATGWVGVDAGALWLVGLALCAAAIAAPAPREALLLSIVAVGWVSPVFAAWHTRDGLPAAMAPVVAALAVPAMWQLLVDGTARGGRGRRTAVVTVWAVSGAAATVLLVLRDPFLDVRCLGECARHPLLILSVPGIVPLAHLVLDLVAVTVAVTALAWSIVRLAQRRRVAPLAPVPALVVAGTVGASWWIPLSDGASAGTLLEPAMAWALAILAAVRITVGVSFSARRAALRRLSDDLAHGTQGDVQGRLAAALRIADLRLLYPLDDGRCVDASGVAHERPTGVELTELRREGKPIAFVVGSDRRSELEEIGAAATLAIDNERLRAGIAANLSDLRRSRLRVVEAGDAERRRIERNLHDGMQQSLLILQYELGLAATREADPAGSAALDVLRAEAHRIVESLREIAHGVFPAALDDLGVDAALQRLADDAAFPLEVSGGADLRAPGPVERTIYLVASEAVAAGTDGGGVMGIELGRTPDAVVVRTVDATNRVSLSLRDRIDALGGRLATRESGVEVELPCASS